MTGYPQPFLFQMGLQIRHKSGAPQIEDFAARGTKEVVVRGQVAIEMFLPANHPQGTDGSGLFKTGQIAVNSTQTEIGKIRL